MVGSAFRCCRPFLGNDEQAQRLYPNTFVPVIIVLKVSLRTRSAFPRNARKLPKNRTSYLVHRT